MTQLMVWRIGNLLMKLVHQHQEKRTVTHDTQPFKHRVMADLFPVATRQAQGEGRWPQFTLRKQSQGIYLESQTRLIYTAQVIPHSYSRSKSARKKTIGVSLCLNMNTSSAVVYLTKELISCTRQATSATCLSQLE